ncbi:hypothetical protein HUT11_35380 (plasmid) [Streptomyces seoulensis]|nr:hypothetical protein HUT11_35380 [Streptomyces seoulensis]
MPAPSPDTPTEAADHTVQPAGRSAEENIADYAEASMNARGQSLTNPATAAAYTATLALAGQTLRGAVAQGLISEEQRVKLADLLAALENAPRHL